jgi:hypothetical protein
VAKPKSPYLAVLRWNDAYGKQEQVYAEAPTDHAPLVVETAGWISKADDVGVTIFSERIANGDGTYSWRGHGFIPHGMVVAIEPVTAKKPRKPSSKSKVCLETPPSADFYVAPAGVSTRARAAAEETPA